MFGLKSLNPISYASYTAGFHERCAKVDLRSIKNLEKLREFLVDVDLRMRERNLHYYEAENTVHFLMGKNNSCLTHGCRDPELTSDDHSLLYGLLKTHRFNCCGIKEDQTKSIAKLKALSDEVNKLCRSGENFIERRLNYDQQILRRAVFSKDKLEQTSFMQCDLNGADFSFAQLNSINFSGANLQNADFDGAVIKDGGRISKLPKRTNFSGADCKGAKFTKDTIMEGRPDFTNADLSGVAFPCIGILKNGGINLPDFSGAKLDGTQILLGNAFSFTLENYSSRFELYFNVDANLDFGGILSCIHSIDDKYAGLKSDLMGALLQSLDDAWLKCGAGLRESEEFRARFSRALFLIARAVTAKSELYFRNSSIIKYYLERVIFDPQVQKLNSEVCMLPESTVEEDLLLAIIRTKTAPDFFALNSNLINQLLYHASISRDQEIRKQGQELFNGYIMKVPELANIYEKVWGTPPAFPEDYIFVSTSDSSSMIVSREYYEKFLLKKGLEANLSLAWNDFIYCKRDGLSEKYVPQQEFDLRQVFKNIILFDAPYQRSMHENGFGQLIDILDLGHFKVHFQEALKLNSYSEKLTDNDSIVELQAIFGKTMQGSQFTHTTIKIKHLNEILAAFGYKDRPKADQAMLLVCLSALFTRFSSSRFFGTEDASPVPLRFYALALLNKGCALDASVMDSDTQFNFQVKLAGMFGAFSCSAILSSDMIKAINASTVPGFKDTLERVKPAGW